MLNKAAFICSKMNRNRNKQQQKCCTIKILYLMIYFIMILYCFMLLDYQLGEFKTNFDRLIELN